MDEREKIVTQQDTDDDVVLNISLRPTSLPDFIGQDQVKENLLIAIEAAKKRGEPLEHILLAGPPGLGKTSLAHIIANEMGGKFTSTSGPAIERAGDLIGVLTNLSEGDILFIDEIHRLSKVVEEFIYPAMENYNIDFVIDKGPYAKTIKFNLKRFTLVGATTRSGLLSSPLRARFGPFQHMDFYEVNDLTSIVLRSAGILEMNIQAAAAKEIALRSRGTPRIANRLLKRVRDWADVKADGIVTQELAVEALNKHGIDSLGLDNIDRKVLDIIANNYKGGPVGIEALASTLNEETDTIVDVVEPYLLKAGLLRRTARGREITDLAYKHLEHGK
jgi:Holliday junction DNA helicase RuvB